ncbi:MAG: DUF3187 family protein, partial [Deltaproteobacteria bacterium]|nr:DUF3187 family protein [Deltaproteobacteria bacterium]
DKSHVIKAFIVFCFLLPFSLQAGERNFNGPFPLRTQHPVYLQNLSLVPTDAKVLSVKELQVHIDAAYSSIFEFVPSPTFDENLDLEILQQTFSFAYGFGRGFELGVDVPFVRYDEGFLDGFLNAYHSTFGFPTAGRELVDNNLFVYRLSEGGTPLMDFPTQSYALGDISLRLKHQVVGEGDRRPDAMIFFDFKLPTAKSSEGVGSGYADFGFGTAFAKTLNRFRLYINAAGYFVGGHRLIARQMNDAHFSSMIAAEYSILEDLSALVQINVGTPMLGGTDLDPWDGVPFDFIVGVAGEEKKLLGNHDLLWKFAFSEDGTSHGPAIDFTVFASLGIRFHFQKGTSSVVPAAASSAKPGMGSRSWL